MGDPPDEIERLLGEAMESGEENASVQEIKGVLQLFLQNVQGVLENLAPPAQPRLHPAAASPASASPNLSDSNSHDMASRLGQAMLQNSTRRLLEVGRPPPPSDDKREVKRHKKGGGRTVGEVLLANIWMYGGVSRAVKGNRGPNAATGLATSNGTELTVDRVHGEFKAIYVRKCPVKFEKHEKWREFLRKLVRMMPFAESGMTQLSPPGDDVVDKRVDMFASAIQLFVHKKQGKSEQLQLLQMRPAVPKGELQQGPGWASSPYGLYVLARSGQNIVHVVLDPAFMYTHWSQVPKQMTEGIPGKDAYRKVNRNQGGSDQALETFVPNEVVEVQGSDIAAAAPEGNDATTDTCGVAGSKAESMLGGAEAEGTYDHFPGAAAEAMYNPRGAGDVALTSAEGGAFHAPDGSYIQTVRAVHDMGRNQHGTEAAGVAPAATPVVPNVVQTSMLSYDVDEKLTVMLNRDDLYPNIVPRVVVDEHGSQQKQDQINLRWHTLSKNDLFIEGLSESFEDSNAFAKVVWFLRKIEGHQDRKEVVLRHDFECDDMQRALHEFKDEDLIDSIKVQYKADGNVDLGYDAGGLSRQGERSCGNALYCSSTL